MQETNIDVMENMPVHRAILKLSIPALITTVISLIYNLTDTFFIGLLSFDLIHQFLGGLHVHHLTPILRAL